jgi:hypothetical protein
MRGGWPGVSFPSFSAHLGKMQEVPQVRFLNLGLGSAVAALSHQTRKFPVYPEPRMANSFRSLDFHPSHSNDT